MEIIDSLNLRIVYCEWCGKKIRETEEKFTLLKPFEFCSKECEEQWDYNAFCTVGDGTEEVEERIAERRTQFEIEIVQDIFNVFKKYFQNTNKNIKSFKKKDGKKI